MDAGQLVGLSIFASYFLLILALFLRIATSLRWRNVESSPRVFLALTAGAFAHTWYYMFSFMSWSFRNYEHALETSQAALPTHLRIANWLCNTGLFEQAWVAVCFGPTPWSWWWSQQLCLFTAGAWTTFLTLEGRRRGVRHLWAYALLGQLVAISVAAALLFYACALSPPARPPPRRAPPTLWLPVALALLAVALSPHTDAQTSFLPTLLAMHALLVLPPVLPPPRRAGLPLAAFSALVAAPALALHLRATLAALAAAPALRGAGAALYYHPAQASIGWDVVWTTGAVLVWRAWERGDVRDVARAAAGVAGDVVRVCLGSVGVLGLVTVRSERWGKDE